MDDFILPKFGISSFDNFIQIYVSFFSSFIQKNYSCQTNVDVNRKEQNLKKFTT